MRWHGWHHHPKDMEFEETLRTVGMVTKPENKAADEKVKSQTRLTGLNSNSKYITNKT